MSSVLDIVVFTAPHHDDGAEFARIVAEVYGHAVLKPICDYAGTNGKWMQSEVFAGAINYADLNLLGRAIRRAYDAVAERGDDGYLQVAWKNEHDDGGYAFATFQKDYVSPADPLGDDFHRLLAGWHAGTAVHPSAEL